MFFFKLSPKNTVNLKIQQMLALSIVSYMYLIKKANFEECKPNLLTSSYT